MLPSPWCLRLEYDGWSIRSLCQPSSSSSLHARVLTLCYTLCGLPSAHHLMPKLSLSTTWWTAPVDDILSTRHLQHTGKASELEHLHSIISYVPHKLQIPHLHPFLSTVSIISQPRLMDFHSITPDLRMMARISGSIPIRLVTGALVSNLTWVVGVWYCWHTRMLDLVCLFAIHIAELIEYICFKLFTSSR